ncbi:MAG: hypothetical protein ACKOWZ_05305 [Sediminibacterium sp.]|jgi:hypothetical protein
MKKIMYVLLVLFVASTNASAQHVSIQLNFPGGYSARPIMRAPNKNAVWIRPEWVWVGNEYKPKAGYWAMPPRNNARWMPGYWKRTRRGHIWIEGRWLF